MSSFSRRSIGLLAMALLLLGLAVPLVAQQAPEGRIVGVVHDQSGAVVPGATITITNEATTAKFTATAGPDGNFVVPSLSVGFYTVQVSAKGFSNASYTQVKVDAGKEYSLSVSLKVGATNETVEVQAGQELVNTSTSEVAGTVSTSQIQNLPLNGRDIISLAQTQAGVGGSGRTATSINGQRPSWSQVTLDGINIQDLFIRTNALDYIPNRPTTDTVQEFTVSTSGQGADASLGSSGVRMVTPSGTNDFHGRLYEYNKNTLYDANRWFNNHNGVPKPALNINEFGGNLGGHIIKNKLFFYGFYEAIRDHEKSTNTMTIPLNADYLTGNFRYRDKNNSSLIHTVNVMSIVPNLTIDPKVAAFLAQVPSPSLANTTSAGDGRNTSGYSFTARSNYTRDNYGFKIDYNLNDRHHFDGTYNHMHEYTDRPDIDTIHAVPDVYNDSSPKMFTGAWRWTITNTFINNFRAGANIVNAPFAVGHPETNFIWATNSSNQLYGVTSPQQNFLPQGRNPQIRQFMDDASWAKGSHYFTMGGSYQQQRIWTYNAAGTVPTVNFGFSASAPTSVQLYSSGCTAANQSACDFFAANPISATDLATANARRAFLAGIISSASQTFQATSATSGYVPGHQQERNLRINDLSLYIQDKWKAKSNLTLNYGVKWEYLSPYKDANNLQVGPVYADANSPIYTLMNPNGQVGILQQAWRPRYRNFGPTVGFAWDPFKNGKTSLRGGYTLTYVNDDMYRFAGNAADGNAGLSSTASITGLYSTLSAGLPTVPTPTFMMPRYYSDQMNISQTNVVWALDPNTKVPMVHELNFGVERELPKEIGVAVRYVGTFGRNLLRGVDLNQTNAGTNTAFLNDFSRARANLFNCGTPAGTATCGTALTYITAANLGASSASLANSTVQSYIAYGQAADLADWYTSQRWTYTKAPNLFLPNPGIYAVDYGTNAAQSSYHSLQLEARRRLKNGLQLQSNFVWSKLLSTSPTGDSGQTRFDPYLDNARPWLNKGRADYDLRWAFKANAIYDLPFGKGKMLFGNAPSFVDKIIGGWQLSGIYTLQAGNPWGLTDPIGTFNRGGRSGIMSPYSTMTQDQIKKLFGWFEQPDGRIYYLNPQYLDLANKIGTNINATLNYDPVPSSQFTQIFFDPRAGQIGNLGILPFDGPRYMNLDLGLAKNTKITERVNLQLRMDAFNAPNHTTFYIGDRNVWATNFGQITSQNTSNRQVQIGARLQF